VSTACEFCADSEALAAYGVFGEIERLPREDRSQTMSCVGPRHISYLEYLWYALNHTTDVRIASHSTRHAIHNQSCGDAARAEAKLQEGSDVLNGVEVRRA